MNAAKKLELPLDFVRAIEMEECEPGYLLGRIEILGVPHHVELIEVEETEHGKPDESGYCRTSQDPKLYEITSDDEETGNHNDTRFEKLCDLTESSHFYTVELDGREWVLYVTPFGN